MKITDRDIEIMRFINEFGFCEMPHIETRFDLKKPRSYQVMKRLITAEFVMHERIFFGRHGMLYLSRKGAGYSDIPPIKSTPKDTYEHQVFILNIHLQLKCQYPNANWISERRIIHDKFMNGISKDDNHLPDGILVFPDLKQVAIEVELTMKSKKRLEDILWDYALHKHIKEVWYYCPPDVASKVAKVAEKMDWVKIFTLN